MGEDWVEVLDPSEKNQHSKLGIASCVVVLIVWGLLFLQFRDFLIPTPITSETPAPDFNYPAFKQSEIVEALTIWVSFFLLLFGTVLGFISLRGSNSKKAFGVIGLVANVLTLCLAGGFVLVVSLLWNALS